MFYFCRTCFIHGTLLYITFLAPLSAVIIVNSVLFIMCMVSLSRTSDVAEKKKSSIKRKLKAGKKFIIQGGGVYQLQATKIAISSLTQ